MFGIHNVVGTAIRFTGNNRYLRNGCFTESVQKLRSVFDDSPPRLVRARHEPRYVNEDDKRNVECITEPYKASPLYGRINIKSACHFCRLVGHNPHWPSTEPGKANEEIGSEQVVYFKET